MTVRTVVLLWAAAGPGWLLLWALTRAGTAVLCRVGRHAWDGGGELVEDGGCWWLSRRCVRSGCGAVERVTSSDWLDASERERSV